MGSSGLWQQAGGGGAGAAPDAVMHAVQGAAHRDDSDHQPPDRGAPQEQCGPGARRLQRARQRRQRAKHLLCRGPQLQQRKRGHAKRRDWWEVHGGGGLLKPRTEAALVLWWLVAARRRR